MKKFVYAFACLLGSIALGGGAQAIPAGTIFVLGDHPDGAKSPPPYGIRLDNLFGTGGVYTFSFDNPASSVTAEFTGSQLLISGTIYGGKDIGTTYDSVEQGLFSLDFTYNGVTVVDATTLQISGSGGSIDSNVGSGLLTFLSSGGSSPWLIPESPISLAAKSNGSGLFFQVGEGHRGEDGLSGWGWINSPSDDDGRCCQDFLFTAEPTDPSVPVPEPLTLGLVATGLLGVGIVARRRRALH